MHWTRHQACISHEGSQAIEAALEVSFPDVEWNWLQQVYGWAALQYQAWARGRLVVGGEEIQRISLFTDSILEYCVDGVPYFGGDYYVYRRAPLVLKLQPGIHIIDVRIIRDVRTMGAMSPLVSIRIRAETSPAQLVIMEEKLLMSDVVNGTLASPFASVPARNDGDVPIAIRAIEALGVSIIGLLVFLADVHQRRILPLICLNILRQ